MISDMKSTDLSVVTYNIQHGLYAKQILTNISTLQTSYNPQIICLQEVRKPPNELFLLDNLLKKLGKNWDAVYSVGERHYLDLGECTLWDTSSIQILNHKIIHFPKIKRVGIMDKLLIKDKKDYDVLRGAIIAEFRYKSKPIRVSNIHLDWQGGNQHREEQIAFLSKFLRKKPYQFEVVCGDFNTLGFNFVRKKHIQRIERKLGEGFLDCCESVGWTCHMDSYDPQSGVADIQRSLVQKGINLKQRLDYILVKGFKRARGFKENMNGSDHMPLVAELEV